MYNYSIGLNAVVREFQMERLCCSCTFQSVTLYVRVRVEPIEHWAAAVLDLHSQMARAGVAPPALAQTHTHFQQDLALLFL